MINSMKQVCSNCHFLKTHGGIPPHRVEEYPNEKVRDSIKKGNFEAATKYAANLELVFGCEFKIWSEGYESSRTHEERQERINETSRKNKCFFFKYTPGMLIPAAKELQKREYELNFARKDRRHTIIGLWIAGGALAVNVLEKAINRLIVFFFS